MYHTIKIKRGLYNNLPSKVNAYELLYTTDTNCLFIGDTNGTPIKITQDIIIQTTAPTAINKRIWWKEDTNEVYYYSNNQWNPLTFINDALLNSNKYGWSSQKIVTYITNQLQLLNIQQNVRVATITAISTSTINNTLVYNNNINLIGIDGITDLQLNDLILIKNQTNPIDNGLYYISQIGDTTTPTIFTRANNNLMPGMLFFIEEGLTQQYKLYILHAHEIILGITALNFLNLQFLSDLKTEGGLEYNNNILSLSIDTTIFDTSLDFLTILNNSITSTLLSDNIDMSLKNFRAADTIRLNGRTIADLDEIEHNTILVFNETTNEFEPITAIDGGTFI